MNKRTDTCNQSVKRISNLRACLLELGVDGFIIPHNDEYNNEFLPENAERLKWITGFDGSAGIAIVLDRKAAIFVDGRYTLQLSEQADSSLFSFHHLIELTPIKWLAENLSSGLSLGYDPWLHNLNSVEKLREVCGKVGASLVAVDENPIDAIWEDQPSPPLEPIFPHELCYAGVSSKEKREELANYLKSNDTHAVILTDPASIAWVLNIRGKDVPYTPLPLSTAILHSDSSVDWFVKKEKINESLLVHLGHQVRISDPDNLKSILELQVKNGSSLQICPDTAASWIFDQLSFDGADIRKEVDPVIKAKSIKNKVELDGSRSAHRRDGAAIARFLFWLSANAESEKLSEKEAAEKLTEFRKNEDLFQGLSFETISGAGPNGAIVHYRVDEESNRLIKKDEFYLIDSGGQYLDGTTDVTRTVSVGEPSNEMRDRYTRVLKGHIAIANAIFPKGTTGSQLDVLARQYLWQLGLDYDHGTGHGVGSYLGVHEGPQRISKVGACQELVPCMILSNEPGYYKEGEYGIRIENLIAVTTLNNIDEAEREMLGFETITLVPLDLNCIKISLLKDDERAWINNYHTRVKTEISPLVDTETKKWLRSATQPL